MNYFTCGVFSFWGSCVAGTWLSGKYSTNAGATGDATSIPGMGRSPEKGMATHSNILAWKIPWAEEATIHGAAKSQV